MIDTAAFFTALQQSGVDFFTGVPDSLLKDFCAHLAHQAPAGTHLTAANEGGAIALAAGHYLATGRPALVYMQNSGLGNAVNPLVSLADPAVYGIPMLLLVGWRGKPGVKDEPQHVKQGEITPDLCRTLGLPHCILPPETGDAVKCLQEMVQTAVAARRPGALIVPPNSFSAVPTSAAAPSPYAIRREAAVACIAAALPPQAAIVSTTGHISRELFEYRAQNKQGHQQDFLTVGSMGHASQIALGIALAQPERPVACLDGDGAVLMHMGALAIAGTVRARNLLHVVLNNGAHDSVGGQETAGFAVDFVRIAEACGYRTAGRLDSLNALAAAVRNCTFRDGPVFLEIRVAKGARRDLGRPTSSPQENKNTFMEIFRSDEPAGS